ncbi:MAG: type I DNA topoisomerase [Planctomycetota bacterium]|jgi:DNA topoisomerase-1
MVDEPEVKPDAEGARPAKKKPRKKRKRAGKALVIVESPAKARTINKILGTKFSVKACMGHVRDLPKRAFGIDVEKDFQPTYRTIREKSKIIKALRVDSKKAPEVYLAPDPDREGEAIAWHLVQALKVPDSKARRVTFNEITKRAVLEAFNNPGELSMDRVNAQQARRFLDRIVGYKLSPLLWKKVGKGLSAGRVQSVAVRLIVEREQEIRAFTPEEYWTVTAHFDGDNPFTGELTHVDDEETRLKNKEETDALLGDLEGKSYVLDAVATKERSEKAPAPFTTSLLQQQASTRLRYSARRTMAIAQQLYEGVELGDAGSVGLITYMRTDSFRVSEDALRDVRAHIGSAFGEDYVPEKPIYRASRKGAQEAHEAIRPTTVAYSPESIKAHLSSEQFKLYKIIWERFVASQMKPALYLLTDAKIRAGRATFTAKGRQTKFDGFTKLLKRKSRDDDQILPPLEKGQTLALDHLDPKQHFTEPPPRYTEASLVRALEKHGIGRPSTYAPILGTIQDRGYVRQEERKLLPTELGELVTGKLVRHFDRVMDTGFTAEMEKDLDEIEEGQAEWTQVLRRFYDTFIKKLDKATEDMVSEKDKVAEGEVCELCGKPMLERWNRDGKFLGCSAFPDCRNTKSLRSAEAAGENCDQCGEPMVVKRGRFGKFLACTKYPECKNTRSLARGRRKVTIPQGWSQDCGKCGKPMKVRYGRRGPFIACTGYPDCKNTESIPKEWFRKAGEDAEEKE